jgi:hypothetical protein
MTIGEAFRLISEGRVGMWLDYGGGGRGMVLVRVGGDNSSEKDQAIAPPPFGTAAPTADDARASGLYISAGSPNAAGCWEWLKYLSSATARFSNTFPARTSIATSQAFLDRAKPGAAEVYAAYTDLFKQPELPDTTPAIDHFWFFRAVDRALQGGNLDRELTEAQTLTEQYLGCVRSGGEPSACATQIDPQYQGLGE